MGMECTTAWMVTAAAFLCRFIIGGLMKSFGVFLVYVTEQCDIKVWQYGNTIALLQLIGSIVSVLVSPLAKVVSPRYLLSGAGFMIGAGFILAAVSKNWIMMSLPLILLTGIGIRTSLVFSISLLPQYCDKHYLLSCGLVYTGEPLGTIVFAPLSQFLLDIYGWRSAMALLGTIALHSILCGVIIKPRLYHKLHNTESFTKQLQRGGFFRELSNWFDLILFKDFHFISLMICDLCIAIAWLGWIIYLIPHGIDKGFTPYQSSGLAITGGATFLVGLMAPSLFVDTGFVTEHQARTVAFLLSGAAFVVDPWINSFIGQIFLTAICTISIGIAYTVSMAFAMKVSVGNVAQVVSFSLLAAAIGRYVGGLIPGILFDVAGNFKTSFLALGGFQFVAAAFSGLSACITPKDS